PERPLPRSTESSLRTMPRAAGRQIDAYFGLPGRPRSQALLAGGHQPYGAREDLELRRPADHRTRQSAQHDNWSGLRQLLARWSRQEEPHAVARSRGRPARMEGGRQLHDVPCIPRRSGFKGAATAIETAAACEGALRVLPQPERNDQAAEPGDVRRRPEPCEQPARG